MVWVNQRPLISLVTDANNLFDLLIPAKDFMLFDTTIVGIRISQLNISFTSGGASALKTFAASILVGHVGLDQNDVSANPLEPSVGPPWMWHGFASSRVSGASNVTLNLVTSAQGQGGLLVKAQRRFKENNATLFLLVRYNDGGVIDTNIMVDGFVRTLIRIP